MDASKKASDTHKAAIVKAQAKIDEDRKKRLDKHRPKNKAAAVTKPIG